MRVANIVFNPFKNDSRVLKESISLAKGGFEVEVIAHGDKNLAKEEIVDGIKVKRFGYLDRKITTSKLSKLKIYLSWVKEIARYVKSFDILHCNDLNTLPIAFIVKKFYNKDIKVVYDAHEYETQMNQLNKITKPIAKFSERFLIKYANRVITVSDSIANEYVRLYRIKKPTLVLNTPPYKEVEKKDIFRQKFNISKEHTIFLYQGGLGKGRGIEILLDTFKSFKDSRSVIVFMGYGEFEDTIKKEAKEHRNIYFHEAVSPDILLDYTSSADFGISTIEDICLSYRYSLPNKIFEYIMAEVPVIVSNLPEMKRVIKDNKIGVVAKENSVKGLKEAVKEALKLDKDKLKNNLKKAKKIYNWENQEKTLLEIYKGLK